MSADRLASVVFESVSLVYVDCTHCEDQCFRDVTLSYKAQSSNPTGKSVRRTVRQCKRCGMESSTKTSMIALNQHVTACHAGIPKRRVPKKEVFALPVLPPNQTPAKPIIPNHNSGGGGGGGRRSAAGTVAFVDEGLGGSVQVHFG